MKGSHYYANRILANRFGVIDKTFESKVSRFIVNISLPATILNAVTGSDMAHDQEMLPIFIAAASIFLVAHVVCHFIQKQFHVCGKT